MEKGIVEGAREGGVGERGEEGDEGEARGACRRSQKLETPRMLQRERYCRGTGATTGSDGVPANLIIVALAIAAAAIRAELDLKQLARY